MRRDNWYYATLALILLAAAGLRFSGLDWDRGYLFHPDERKILLVASGIHLPLSIPEFFSPDSPLNPKFFAYGSFPIYLLQALNALAPAVNASVPWSDSHLVGLALLGRALSGIFDLGTIALTFFLARRLYSVRVGLVAAASVALAVLHIQLAHFYAVDTLLTFLAVATVFFAVRFAETGKRLDAVLMGAAFGLAMATKVSAAPLVVPIVVAVVYRRKEKGEIERGRELSRPFHILHRLGLFVRHWRTQIWGARGTLGRIFCVALAMFVITQPYALLDPVDYFGQVGTESLVARGWLDYPYTRQFADTVPFIYQIVQTSIWGMSLPLGILAWGGSALFVWQWWRRRGLAVGGPASPDVNSAEGWQGGIILSWVLVYFLIVGGQYAKYPRYLLPLSPFLFLMAAAAFSRIAHKFLRVTLYVFTILALLCASVYSLAFVSIYSREHPWLQISNWIYQNVPAGSTVAIEHWDDALPVSFRAASGDHNPTEYQMQVLPMYDADDAAKLKTLADGLAKCDYIILASPRLYATIVRLPQRYPISARYYHLLFDGRLGFQLAEFARNDPKLDGITIGDDPIRAVGLTLPPALAEYWRGASVWDWGRADESFAVYDHPMPLVFKKTMALTSAQIQVLLTSP